MSTFTASRRSAPARFVVSILLAGAALAGVALPAHGHQVWIETAAVGKLGEAQEVHVCWGHSGHKESGPGMASQQAKLTVCVLGPGGREPLTLAKGTDSFLTKFSPRAAGYQVIGADLQVGILDQEFHGMPAKTRMVMYGKSLTLVGGGQTEAAPVLGFGLEIVPVSPVVGLKPGDLVTVKVLHKGQPIGGKDVLVAARTCGPLPPPEDERIQTSEWSIESTADPRTGEVTFPLIVGGQHLFYVRYTDETPGTYDGDRNDASAFSHLRKGDTYERTVYVSTLTVQVNGK